MLFCWDGLPGPDLGYRSLSFTNFFDATSALLRFKGRVGILSFGFLSVHKPDLKRGLWLFSKKGKSWQRNLDEVLLNDRRVACKTTSDHAPQLNPSIAIKQDDWPPTAKRLWTGCSERLPLFSGHVPQCFHPGALPAWIRQSARLLGVPVGCVGNMTQTLVETGQFVFSGLLHSCEFLLPITQPSFLGKNTSLHGNTSLGRTSVSSCVMNHWPAEGAGRGKATRGMELKSEQGRWMVRVKQNKSPSQLALFYQFSLR